AVPAPLCARPPGGSYLSSAGCTAEAAGETVCGLTDLPSFPAEAQAIGQPGRLHHAMDVWFPDTNGGIAPYPNRAMGMTGLSPARLRPCRPLHQTPGGVLGTCHNAPRTAAFQPLDTV